MAGEESQEDFRLLTAPIHQEISSWSGSVTQRETCHFLTSSRALAQGFCLGGGGKKQTIKQIDPDLLPKEMILFATKLEDVQA